MARMKLAIKRILSWLLTGASVLLVPQIVYWLYYWYFYATGLFADTFPKIAAVFSFFNDMVEEWANTGICGLFVSFLIYGICVLTIRGSEKLHPSVLGGHFLIAGILSLSFIARNLLSLILILKESGLRNGLQSLQGVLLFLTLIAQTIYTTVILKAFSAMGSLKLLFGNRKRAVFLRMPKDVHESFSPLAYIPDTGGLMRSDGKINDTIVSGCLNRVLQSGILAQNHDCLLCDATLVRKDAVSLKDVIQVHEENGQVFVNPNTPFCELLRMGTKAGLFFCTLKDAREL